MITGKKIAIVGFGIEGVSCANYLGATNQVFVIDQKSKDQIDDDLWGKLKAKGIKFFWKNQMPKSVNVDLVVRSPGVKPDSPQIKKLLDKKTQVTSPTNIFFDVCPCPIIAVTGTKGKGTTATLIYKMLKEKFKDVFLAGNIGMPVLNILPKLKKDAKDGGNIAGVARKVLEKRLGRPIVSKKNFLPEDKNKKLPVK